MPSKERRPSLAPSIEKKKELTPREEVEAALEVVKATWKPESPTSFTLLLKIFQHSIPDGLEIASDVGLDVRGYRSLARYGLPSRSGKHAKMLDCLLRETDELKRNGAIKSSSETKMKAGTPPVAIANKIDHAFARVLAERAKGMDLKQLKNLPEKEDEEQWPYRLATTHLDRVKDVWEGEIKMGDVRALLVEKYQLGKNEALLKVVNEFKGDAMTFTEVMSLLFAHTSHRAYEKIRPAFEEDLLKHRARFVAPVYAAEKMEAEKQLKDAMNAKLAPSGREVALDEKGEYAVREKEGEKNEEKKIEKESITKWEVTEVPADDPDLHSYHELPDGKLLEISAADTQFLDVFVEKKKIFATIIAPFARVLFRSDIPAIVLDEGVAGIKSINIVHQADGSWECQIPSFQGNRVLFSQEYPEKPAVNQEHPLAGSNMPFPVKDWMESHELIVVGGRKYLRYTDSDGRMQLVDEKGVRFNERIKDAQGGSLFNDCKVIPSVNESGMLVSANHHSNYVVWDEGGNIVTQQPKPTDPVMYWKLRDAPASKLFDLVLAQRAFLRKHENIIKRFIIRPKRSGGGEQKENTNETKYISDEKALEEIQKLLDQNADPYSVAMGLAGLDSPEAWEMREDLLTKGAHPNSVAAGLAGLDSPEAWEMRNELLIDIKGTNPNSVAHGLAGLDSPEAWKMREDLLARGADLGDIVLGLAGLNSPRAWEMRKDLLAKGVYLSFVAISLAGLDSPEAWEMRKDILAKGVYLGSVAQGLAGLDSPEAWKMRKELLAKNADPGSVAQGLAGLDSPEAWEMRKELLSKGVDLDSVALGIVGNHTTFVWRLNVKKNEEKKEPVTPKFDPIMTESLRLLNTVHDPKSVGEVREVSEYWEKFLKAPQNKRLNPEALRRAIVEHPEHFLKDIAAVADDSPKHLAHKLVMRMFPEAFSNQGSGTGVGGWLKERFGKGVADPKSSLRSRGDHVTRGGGMEALKDTRKVLELREPMRGFLATGLFGACDKETGTWKELDFPIERGEAGSSVVTAVIPDAANLGRAVLPMPLNGSLLPERVKAHVKKGEKPVETMKRSTGICEASIPSGADSLAYSFTVGTEKPLRDVSKTEMDRFSKLLSDISAETFAELRKPLAKIPQSFLVGLFTDEFRKLEPKQQVVAIERFVRANGHYDIHNEVVSDEKAGRPLDEQWAICKDRAKELKSGKMFAGVCADYGSLTVALLRKAGFASGVTTGFGVDGKEVQMRDTHEAAFVLWPDDRGRPRAALVDGTPSSSEEVARHVAMPTIEEREEKAEGASNEQFEQSVAMLEALERALGTNDPTALRELWNGKLEHAVNAILGAVRPGHARAVRALLDGYWYSPLAKMDPSKPGFRDALVGGLKGVLDYEREHAPVNETGEHTAGRTAFIAIEDFADRLVKSHAVKTSADAYRAVRAIVDISAPILEKDERRVFEAVTAYLEAKKMFG